MDPNLNSQTNWVNFATKTVVNGFNVTVIQPNTRFYVGVELDIKKPGIDNSFISKLFSRNVEPKPTNPRWDHQHYGSIESAVQNVFFNGTIRGEYAKIVTYRNNRALILVDEKSGNEILKEMQTEFFDSYNDKLTLLSTLIPGLNGFIVTNFSGCTDIIVRNYSNIMFLNKIEYRFMMYMNVDVLYETVDGKLTGKMIPSSSLKQPNGKVSRYCYSGKSVYIPTDIDKYDGFLFSPLIRQKRQEYIEEWKRTDRECIIQQERKEYIERCRRIDMECTVRQS